MHTLIILLYLFFGQWSLNLLSSQHHELLSEGVAQTINVQCEKAGCRRQNCLVSDLSTGVSHEGYVTKVKYTTEHSEDILYLLLGHVHNLKGISDLQRGRGRNKTLLTHH